MQLAVQIVFIVFGIIALLIIAWLVIGVYKYIKNKEAIKDANERGISNLSPIMAILMWPMIPVIWME